MDRISAAEHRSRVPLRMGTRELRKYYPDGMASTPTNRVTAAKHHSGGLLGMGMKGW